MRRTSRISCIGCFCFSLFFCSVLSLLVSSPRFFPPLTFTTSERARTSKTLHISNMSGARRDPGVADHISYPPHSLANASKKKCNFKTLIQQDLEELVLLYRFMPSIPRETLKTQRSRQSDLNFPQLYKLELASLTRLSPDDGCNRPASVTPSN